MSDKMFLTQKELDFYHAEGYIVKRNLFSEEEMTKLKNEYTKIWAQFVSDGTLNTNSDDPLDSLFRTMFHIHRKNPYVLKFMLDPRNFSIAKEILNEEALAIATTMFYKGPKMRGTETHRDYYGYGYGTVGSKSCAIWISLDYANQQNGGIFVIPKTHKLGMVNISINIGHTQPAPEGYEVVHIETQPGDAIIWDSLTVHGSPPNQTEDQFRRAFFIYFTGVSVEKVLDGHNQLVNQYGETVTRPLNRKHKEFKDALVKAPFWANIQNDATDSFRSKYIKYLD